MSALLFDFQRYRIAPRFSDNMDMLMSAAGIEVDRSAGTFQHIGQMREWRNLLTYASPHEIESTEIENTTGRPASCTRAWPIPRMPRVQSV